MGALDERLMVDLKDAMRSGDTVRRDVIRYLRAAFKNAQIARIEFSEDEANEANEVQRSANRDQPLSDAEELAVLQRQIKQRQDSIEQFERSTTSVKYQAHGTTSHDGRTRLSRPHSHIKTSVRLEMNLDRLVCRQRLDAARPSAGLDRDRAAR